MKIIQNYSLSELKEELNAYASVKRFRAIQIYEFAYKYVPIGEMTNLPKELRDTLSKDFTSIPVTIFKDYKSKDGEVLAVNKYLGGSLKEDRKITNIVLMGSGEPLDNYDNVVKFVKLISSTDGINISQRNISLSTCGLPQKIKQLADENLGITLTISLHASTDENRQKIMKIASVYSLADLFESIYYYYKKTKRRVVFEYILSKGNVSRLDAKRIASLTKGLSCHVNMIPINKTPSSPLLPASKEKIKEFFDTLKESNISATTRRTLGSDIEGACGQLRRKVLLENGEIK